MRILVGFIMMVIGALITIYSEQMLKIVGRIDWAERKLLTWGGSRFFYQMLGILVIFIGLLLVFNFYDRTLRWVLSPLIR